MSHPNPRPDSDFRAAAVEHGITRWPQRQCSICGYQLAFLFESGEAYFDPGCYCTGGRGIEPRPWASVAEQYNMQSHPRVIAEYDEFWHFAPNVIDAGGA